MLKLIDAKKCHGLFFDHLDKKTLRSMEGAESIDIGDEFVGVRFNEILDVTCPKCQTKMEHVLQSDPFEIKFECCPSYKEIYFDAGEFRDYLEDEIYQQFQEVIDQL
ncbi:MAG: hypothetical protein HOB98_04705 [Gammaproteobacteria bacterium]|jgi:hypothetical protein|nr:hypothetical protein [Gammaproteobacteria bacterium]MBT3866952.1 hypothetical protein [Gammaproteobacteria bacterium]MBT4380808.1 hypothetical protein [Gammaproteobacteria bacterium]MBT4615731.1 hypothetical protein [Gammaproteobacteria bacterium]MBT5198597.1 hypothetical protein [Gammaproteobacteria bacterium]